MSAVKSSGLLVIAISLAACTMRPISPNVQPAVTTMDTCEFPAGACVPHHWVCRGPIFDVPWAIEKDTQFYIPTNCKE